MYKFRRSGCLRSSSRLPVLLLTLLLLLFLLLLLLLLLMLLMLATILLVVLLLVIVLVLLGGLTRALLCGAERTNAVHATTTAPARAAA
mmetsp:Transcript_8875/g.19503  ORF Transcript_8875/g.19503 Transcript_8875/m.19503 type:complete len:89 (-) Transcript_8875:873-1139(-)